MGAAANVTTVPEILAYYAASGPIASGGAEGTLYADLPDDVAGLARVVQGLLIHQHVGPSYGVPLTTARIENVHVRPTERRLQIIQEIDPRPLTQARPIETRLV